MSDANIITLSTPDAEEKGAGEVLKADEVVPLESKNPEVSPASCLFGASVFMLLSLCHDVSASQS